MGATVWKPFFQRPLVHDYSEKISTFCKFLPQAKKNILPIDHFFEDIFRQSWPDTSKKYHPLSSEAPRGIHPQNLTWNPKMKVWFRCFSLSNGWFSGSKMLVFRGVTAKAPGKWPFFSEMILSLLGLCFDLFSGANLLLLSGRGFSPLINEHDNGISSGSTPPNPGSQWQMKIWIGMPDPKNGSCHSGGARHPVWGEWTRNIHMFDGKYICHGPFSRQLSS